ncbi:hypothetical protein [Brachybacterium kimchii]|uniref:Phage FDXHR zinc binding domain-containing protein n=1 Tax=Brachybacterium kimchii TaxID=2942909 RepID=A0ABY4N893_9MICO|nr:hypothetical protein [Brachybacterium kimchii]UQN29584.1 hypothetical protein M4486_18445 [Brachybacterium kimchii]
MSARDGISHDAERDLYIVTLGGVERGSFPTRGQALRALENGTGYVLGESALGAVEDTERTRDSLDLCAPVDGEPSRRLTRYQLEASRIRSDCPVCMIDERKRPRDRDRPEYVSLKSWHTWGHEYAGAPDSAHPYCPCGTELNSGPRFWHCGGCHETFAGEKPFTLHRKGRGGERYCLDMLNDCPSKHWEDARGVWHYGPQDARHGSPESTRAVAA